MTYRDPHGGHPHPGTVRVERLDPTPRGWVMQIEERWADEDGAPWYCREMFRADVTGGLFSDLAIYCCGDWDEARLSRRPARRGSQPAAAVSPSRIGELPRPGPTACWRPVGELTP